MKNEETNEIKQLKKQIDIWSTTRDEIDLARDKISGKIRKMRDEYNAVAHKEFVGKCFKVKSWSDEEVGDRGEEPYWMYGKILSLYRDDQCLCEEFSMEINKNTGDKRVITSFRYVHNDRSFIDFYKGKADGIEYIPISVKEYNAALAKCLKACNLVNRGKK
jgi:hypothetical protein